MSHDAPASQLTLVVERCSDFTVVHCGGRLVAGVTDRFVTEVRQVIPGCKRIVLELVNLTHMDSTGLGALVRLYVSAKSSGCVLELVNIGKPIRHLLGVTHLLSVLEAVGKNNIRMG
ncbi:MAG: STAS domain-containing protein [Terriglobales bacterium]